MTDANVQGGSRPAGRKQPRFTRREPFFFELSRLMVVALKASSESNFNHLFYRAQTRPNGPWEGHWTPIDTTYPYGLMAAGLTGDGRVAVIAQLQTPVSVMYIDEARDSGDVQPWHPPVPLGEPEGVNAFVDLAMAVDAGARLELFGTDDSGRLWWKYRNPDRIVQKTVQVTPPGTDTPITITVDESAPPLTPWSAWIKLVGPPGGLGRLRAIANADGRIMLFGFNPQTSYLYRSEQRIAQALQPSDWSEWVEMDDQTTGIFGSIAPVLDSLGAVNLFGIDAGGQVLQ